jgi:flagellar secretion chaperone FliS
MNAKEIERECWQLSAQNASPVGLVIILYDVLSSDLRRAIEAVKSRDIEKRSHALNHAFLVLGELEGSLNRENGGEAARLQVEFYSHIRAKVLEAQIKASAEILERQIELILDVRGAWEQLHSREHCISRVVEKPEPSSHSSSATPAWCDATSTGIAPSEDHALSWSA